MQNSLKMPTRKLRSPTGLPPSTAGTVLHHQQAVEGTGANHQPLRSHGKQVPHRSEEPTGSFIAQVKQYSAQMAAVVDKREELSRNEDDSSVQVPGTVPEQEPLEGDNGRGVLDTGAAPAMTQASLDMPTYDPTITRNGLHRQNDDEDIIIGDLEKGHNTQA